MKNERLPKYTKDWKIKKKNKKKNKKKTKKNKFSWIESFQKEAQNLPYYEFLNSRYWFAVRKIILKRDNYMCFMCKSTDDLVVHHMTYKNHKNEHNHKKDLITLCKDCHYDVHCTFEIK